MADTLPPEVTERLADATHDVAAGTREALALTGQSALPDPDAWERIIGAFGESPDLADWWAAGHAIREAERPPA